MFPTLTNEGETSVTSAFVASRPTTSLAASAAQQIKALILSSGMKPGDLLPSEAELCERLGVSRSSIREAIRTLNTLEIVDVQHGRGTFVGQMSLQPLVETLAFRSVITPGDDFLALREVVDVRVSLDLGFADRVVAALVGSRNEHLHSVVDRMMAKAADGHSFPQEDREFHTGIMQATGLEMVRQLVTAFWDVHTVVLPQLSIPNPTDMEQTLQAHREMLVAAESGDVEAYREAVLLHYAPLQRVLGQTASE